MTRKRPRPRPRRATGRRPAASKKPSNRRAGKPATRRAATLRARRGPSVEVREIESLRSELERVAGSARPPRWNADPDDVRRSVVKLVLTLVDFIRQLLERQAIRRVETGTLTAEQTEAIGTALMRLEATVRDLGAQFDLAPEDLNFDLGPIGKLV